VEAHAPNTAAKPENNGIKTHRLFTAFLFGMTQLLGGLVRRTAHRAGTVRKWLSVSSSGGGKHISIAIARFVSFDNLRTSKPIHCHFRLKVYRFMVILLS
jgi:hypothetical protein